VVNGLLSHPQCFSFAAWYLQQAFSNARMAVPAAIGLIVKNFLKLMKKTSLGSALFRVANENRGENLADEWTVGD
jgi:hypothetical protein